MEARLQHRAARQAMTRRRREQVAAQSWAELVLELLAAGVAVGIFACTLIVLKGVVVVVVVGATLWLHMCVLRCCCAVWPAESVCRYAAKAVQVMLVVARASAGDVAATGCCSQSARIAAHAGAAVWLVASS